MHARNENWAAERADSMRARGFERAAHPVGDDEQDVVHEPLAALHLSAGPRRSVVSLTSAPVFPLLVRNHRQAVTLG